MVSCQAGAFSLPAGLHYLNCAYMAPLSRRVEEAGIAGVREKRDPSGIGPEAFFAGSDLLRRRFARLVGIRDPRRVAIVPSVSYGLATVARNTALERGGSVVVAGEQFPSNVYPWRRLAAGAGTTLRTVDPPDRTADRGRRWNERFLEAIDQGTALVALGQVHWADGTRFDLEAIGARAREVGAALVIDGTQSVGAMPFDMERIRPDALVCAGYKWLLGPYAIGLAYYGERYDEGVPLEENWLNRGGSEDFAALVRYRDDYQPGAARYDVGERSNPILVPMLSTAIEQLLEWGVEGVQAYCSELTRPFVEEVREQGLWVEEEEMRAAHLFGVRLAPATSLEGVRAALTRRRVVVSVRGSALRVSPNVYNAPADLAALADALAAPGG